MTIDRDSDYLYIIDNETHLIQEDLTMRFVCDVFNKVQGFCDRYMVVAQNSKEARKELIARLDDETDETSKGFVSSVSLAIVE